MKTNIQTQTDGSGYWSDEAKNVTITEIELSKSKKYDDDVEEYGHLLAYFDADHWNRAADGLIYTDNLWLNTFCNGLRMLGFNEEAISNLNYSEQGMQGEAHVDLDVGEAFIKEFERIEALQEAKA
jgi:hypothetical protein